MSTVLCIFTREPVLGAVKRRLAADIGDAAAFDAHKRLLDDTLERLANVEGMVSELWVAGSAAAMADQVPPGIAALREQCPGDLGVRMSDALATSLIRAPRALVVGSDCPGIDATYVSLAAVALASHDVVLGPAEDGGYGLIGTRVRDPAVVKTLFHDIPWGTDRVLASTLHRARAMSLSVDLLPEIWDVDDVAGWRRYLDSR
ncbi:MAG: TIGR04282 family arsenosugar biosynthesis glycosyltransferase [Pseudomonadales bacterium]